MNPRYKPLLAGGLVLVTVWLLAWTGMHLAAQSRMTPEKMATALRATHLDRLNPEARARRLRELADQLNKLAGDERRRARGDREWDRLWLQMSENEKGQFIESTMPAGVKQMLTAFEQLPEDKRRSTITNAIARMQSEREPGAPMAGGPADREPLSEEMQKKVITTGLKTFYAESSAQTKAEMAPLLEEMQRMMQTGRMFRR